MDFELITACIHLLIYQCILSNYQQKFQNQHLFIQKDKNIIKQLKQSNTKLVTTQEQSNVELGKQSQCLKELVIMINHIKSNHACTEHQSNNQWNTIINLSHMLCNQSSEDE